MPGEDLPEKLGGGKSPYQYKIPLIAYDAANKPELRGHFDPDFADFNVSYPDQFRADEFLREFGAFVHARETGMGEQLPSFVLLRLPDDHTAGTRPGSPTPTPPSQTMILLWGAWWKPFPAARQDGVERVQCTKWSSRYIRSCGLGNRQRSGRCWLRYQKSGS